MSVTLPALFTHQDAFATAFADGLHSMLAGDSLGGFILALANASNDARLWQTLRRPLATRFETLMDARKQGLLDHAAADDLAVFDALCAVGFDALQQTCGRQLGDWRLQFNQLRSFRPPRMSNARVNNLRQPFDPTGFHFNKPFLASEILWEGDLHGVHCRWLYNKFPFAPLHTLLVVEPDAQRPQWLREWDHAVLWRLTARLGKTLPGLGFGYNAYGAYASVNHQHFQGFVGAGYPVEAAHWCHNDGDQPYPVDCRRHDDVAAAWADIASLHAANTPYNLLYRPGHCYLLPRAFQGHYAHADWTGGFAWSEMAGVFTLFDAEKMAALEGAAIVAEFAKLRV